MLGPVLDEDLAHTSDAAVRGEVGGQTLHIFLIEEVERACAAVVPDVAGERDVREDETDRDCRGRGHGDSFDWFTTSPGAASPRPGCSPQEGAEPGMPQCPQIGVAVV
ncbi:hypothetical protein GWO62_08975 [Corynebacterium macginleyi]|uniref:hypothetical protein n=1 Tax=Corynebacterium macginleyi TaxID=38290 RepID=UPI00190D8B76|nr:hypothetical protein [Corynebacterium macginleyi]MBK4153266.1 hypothetical protein [Corynebacterium macginleyi]